MKIHRVIAPLILAGFVLGLVAVPGIAQQAKPEAKQTPSKTYIPKEIKDILAQNLATRQTRQDIPFTIFKQLYLPARDASYIYFFYKIKNSDLGFVPAPAQPGAAADAPVKLKAVFDVFLQFHQMEEGKAGQGHQGSLCPGHARKGRRRLRPQRRGVVHGRLSADAGILSPGHERHHARSQEDRHGLQRLRPAGLQVVRQRARHDPDHLPERIQGAPDRRDDRRVPSRLPPLRHSPDLAEHRQHDQRWAIRSTTFFYIYGAKPDASGAFNIECQFEVKKGEEPMIKFAPQSYPNPFVSQPLPMKQTLVTKTTDEKGVVKESQKVQDLGVGELHLHGQDHGQDLGPDLHQVGRFQPSSRSRRSEPAAERSGPARQPIRKLKIFRERTSPFRLATITSM